jgi:hypothetical protein
MKSALADRLMQFCSHYYRQISEQWYKSLSTSAKTPAFRSMPYETCTRHAGYIYQNLEKLYFAEDPEKAVAHLVETSKFVEDHLAYHIPLEQTVYSIILLRRHIWLYAESQALYNGVEDMMQMVENINRVVLVFDYIIFTVTKKYPLLQKQ